MTTITAILLAAGLSRRFGATNKLLADVNGMPMVQRVARALCDSEADHVIVVLGHEAQKIDAALHGLAVETILNPDFENGQVTSVRAGLVAVGDDATGIMMCLSDQPLLAAEDYNALIDAFTLQPDRVVVPFLDGKRGNPVVLPSTLKDSILDGGMNVGCRSFIDQNPHLVLPVDVAKSAYRADFDTPESMKNLRSKLPGQAAAVSH